MVIDARKRRFGVEFDIGGVFVAIIEKIFGNIGVFGGIVEEELSKGDDGETGSLITFECLGGITGKIGGVEEVLVESIFVIIGSESGDFVFDLALGLSQRGSNN